ncbi:PD-(D/E)XK nuclease superfamily protein [Tissierella creatinophila DSM 6911]|uniref:PD-(D/E)XK nuclease superfamily protein n=2 Tax=Tissierella creatinophila TaxID=79681 RepID=A0A1U7M3H7_TISCR|nr:PD-(D/E)XK nuclease superfamily protein [Tissierella creatinophila DSM 6911]
MREMEIWEFASEYILEEKLFIVPTRAIGVLMIEHMAKGGKSALNLNPVTIKKLSQDICQMYIEENDILVIDDILGKSIVLDCLKSLNQESDEFFFKENLIDEKTAEEVYSVIIELKLKKIDDFPKEKDLDKIYKRYTLKLDRLNAMDYCDILLKAREVKELSSFKDKTIAVASNIEFHDLERELFSQLNQNAIKIKMPVKKLIDSPKEYFFKESVESIDRDKKVCFFNQFGIRNEIKYIIDDIYVKSIPLDEVVIAYTDQKYVEWINLEFQKEDLGISFADGLDILTSTTYRFIKTICDFAKNYYNIWELRPMFFNGSLNVETGLEKDDETITSNDIYEELVKCKVFYGRENYERLNFISPELDDKAKVKRKWIREFFNSIMFTLPEGNVEFREYIKRLSILIKKYVKIPDSSKANSYDKTSMKAILETLKRMEKIPLEIEPDRYFDIVLSYIEEINTNRSGARPSKAFACKYNIAAYTGRKHLYLIGLDSSSLDSKIVESAILLDNIRRDISPSLSFSKENYRYKKYKIREALTASFTNISIGYSNFDMVDIKAKTPSKIYTELKEEYGHVEPCKAIDRKLMSKDLIFSGTSIETLGQCSRKLYFKNRLFLKEKEDIEIDLDRWLDALTKGNLVHEILNLYFDLPKEDRDEEILSKLIEERVEKVAKEIPYILKEVYNREKEEIKVYCKKILEREQNSQLEVFINELSFGRNKTNRIFGPLKTQEITIGDLNLTISGAIDRVDIDKKGKWFKIVDYKTGNLANFDKRLRKSEGRGKNKTYDYSEGQKFQFFIYKKALENIIKEKDEYKDFSVKSFSYEFEDDSIDLIFDEEFINKIENRINDLLNIDIFQNDKKIVYNNTDSLTCKYCEFKNICKTDNIKTEEEEVDY